MKRTRLQRRTPLKRKTRLRAKGRTNSKRRRYNAHLASPYWRQIRQLVLDRDDNECTLCDQREGLQVHHVHYETLGRETGEELVTLCEEHHDREHVLGLPSRRAFWHGILPRVFEQGRAAR